ncbi:MAG: Holliday junction resolvase RuvX [Oscillospiraceae bacterium]|nr:Holliday junction resolvase RuvX [Oscillospiraceae bacterium]
MKIFAVDYGDARTGLAHCDKFESIASPVGTVFEWNVNKCLAKVADAIKADGAELIVVGLPVNMDGTQGERAQKCRDFADKLREMTGVETVMWDERVTTVQAIGILNETNVRGKKRKEVIDTVAATLILESYMDYRKKKGLA